MSDILSQNEIDALLKQLSEGDLDVDQIQGEDEKQVKNYDFSRPTKFSKEHLRTLEIIFEHYSRLISTNLPVYLRKNVQVTVASQRKCAEAVKESRAGGKSGCISCLLKRRSEAENRHRKIPGDEPQSNAVR